MKNSVYQFVFFMNNSLTRVIGLIDSETEKQLKEKNVPPFITMKYPKFVYPSEQAPVAIGDVFLFSSQTENVFNTQNLFAAAPASSSMALAHNSWIENVDGGFKHEKNFPIMQMQEDLGPLN